MNVEIPASLYALLQQQQQLAALQQKLTPTVPCTTNTLPATYMKPTPALPNGLTSEIPKTRSAFVDRLVDTAALVIESIWPTQTQPGVKVLPLNVFIQEILRRSKTSFSTLQLALFYIVRVRNQLAKDGTLEPLDAFSYPANEEPDMSFLLTPPASPIPSQQNMTPAVCGRRMFLTSLILASKYLQDRNYSNKAWSKISGLSVSEINTNEFKFLALVEYELFVGHEVFAKWTSLLMAKTQQVQLAQQVAVQNQLQQQQQQQLNVSLVQCTSSLEAPCAISRNAQPPATSAGFLHSLAFAAASVSPMVPVAQKGYYPSPAASLRRVSPVLGDYEASPASVDVCVPSQSDAGFKRGRSFVDEEDSFVKRVCL
ncbi:hypothetical protein HDU98_003985 [Podochytrium sp. JEL0797]|nr:hypothetical protein HDU98_003985 [Podochytrium sp. JEL0797]